MSEDSREPEGQGTRGARLLVGPDPYSPRRIVLHVLLLLATIATTLWVGALYNPEPILAAQNPGILDWMRAGLPYSATLVGILLCHEMGHFIAGRIHRVRLSLPFFIPVPIALGTMGAIIAMPPLNSRRKLLDVGAAGPLAGLVVSTVTMFVGLALSDVRPLEQGMVVFQEGQSLWYMGLKLIVLGPMPEGHDVFLHPIAWASWIGFLVTMLNLIPVGQLDGGHIAYALIGARQNRVSAVMLLGLVMLGTGVSLWYAAGAIEARAPWSEVLDQATTGLSWFVWAFVLSLMRRFGRGWHPPVQDEAPLGFARTAVGISCMILFVLLFMPVPLKVVQL